MRKILRVLVKDASAAVGLSTVVAGFFAAVDGSAVRCAVRAVLVSAVA